MLHVEHKLNLPRRIGLRETVMAEITSRAQWRSRNAIVRTQPLVARRFVASHTVIFGGHIVAVSQESAIIVLGRPLWILALKDDIVTRRANNLIVFQRAPKTLGDIHVANRNTRRMAAR
jgi:hypothetical protein